MKSAPVNAAVKANLERVLDEERRRAALRMAQLRLGVSLVTLTLVLIGSSRIEAMRMTLIGTIAFTAVSAIVYALTRWVPFVGAWGTLATAFIDVPMISLIQHLQAPRLGHAWYGIPTAVGLMCGLVVLSMLSLSKRVIWITAFFATASMARRLVGLDLPWPPIALTLMMPLSIAGVGASLVTRIRALVQAARRRDLVGKYVLGERLGAGGMAEVFEATYSPEPGFERLVAVKRVLPGYSSNRNFLSLFRREAAIGAQLAHPNLVQVLDFGRHLDAWFLAMEYVDGVSLAGLLRGSSRPLPVAAALFVVAEVAEGLTYLHERVTGDAPTGGIVHRDVNPPNVLLSMRGEVKLNDFGVARWAAVSDLTVPGARPGKMGYLPPEPQVGPALDLFALGVTAWETLACARLFGGGSEEQVRARIATEPAPSIRGLRPDVPEEVEQLINALLDKDPSRRPSARAVVLALRALEGEAAPYPNGRPALIRALATMEPG